MICESVKDTNAFDAIVKGFLHGKTGFTTNSVLLPDEIERVAGQGRMTFSRSDEALMFFTDMDSYYTMTFWLAESPSFKSIDISILPLPVTIEYMIRNGNEQKYMQAEAFWGNSGFILNSRADRLALDLESDLFRNIQTEAAKNNSFGQKVEVAELRDIHEILTIWDDTFDAAADHIPHPEEVKNAINQKQIFVIKKGIGEIVALLMFEQKKTGDFLKHITVKQGYRGEGLFLALFRYCLDISLSTDKKKMLLWVREDNTNAFRIYEKLGFRKDGVTTSQYILR